MPRCVAEFPGGAPPDNDRTALPENANQSGTERIASCVFKLNRSRGGSPDATCIKFRHEGGEQPVNDVPRIEPR